MQIKRGAEPDPEINAEHDRQIVKLKASPDRRDPEDLQQNEDRENSDIEFFVLEHSGEMSRRPLPGERVAVSSRSAVKASA